MASYIGFQWPLKAYKHFSGSNLDCLEAGAQNQATTNMASRLLRGLTVFLSGSALCSPVEHNPKNPFNEEFSKYIYDALDEWHTAGVAIGVVDGDDVFMEGYGYSILPDTKATPDTLWYVGSTTKAQLAVALSELIHNKSHPALADGWSTKISSVIPDDFVMQDDWSTSHLTLDDAVSHRTGLGNHDSALLAKQEDRQTTIKDTVRNLRNLPMAVEPRTKFYYSNHMFVVLSHVAATVAGERLASLLDKVLWKPLGMSATFMDTKSAMESGHDLSRGYYWNKEDKNYTLIPPAPVDEVEGAGAVISNVKDYVKWLRCLLNETAPLSKATHEDIKRPRFIDNTIPTVDMSDTSLYSQAWWIDTYHGKRLYYHSGTTTTHGTLLWWIPEINYGVILFGNDPGPLRNLVVRKLVQDKLGIPEDDRVDLASKYKDAIKEQENNLKHVDTILYPDLPRPRQPSSANLTMLAGIYHNAGYGTLHFEEKSDTEQMVLKAEMPNAQFVYRLELEHVSGDFWIAWEYVVGAEPTPTYERASFSIGPDAKPNSLTIYASEGGQVDRVFERVTE